MAKVTPKPCAGPGSQLVRLPVDAGAAPPVGFASALGPLALRGWPLIGALAGFNLGIELVQLTLALIAFAAMFVLAGRTLPMPRISAPYIPARALLPLTSLVILGFSAYWFVDRSFLLVTMP